MTFFFSIISKEKMMFYVNNENQHSCGEIGQQKSILHVSIKYIKKTRLWSYISINALVMNNLDLLQI